MDKWADEGIKDWMVRWVDRVIRRCGGTEGGREGGKEEWMEGCTIEDMDDWTEGWTERRVHGQDGWRDREIKVWKGRRLGRGPRGR